MRVLLALCASVLLFGVPDEAGAVSYSREFAGFYEIGETIHADETTPADDSTVTTDPLRVMLNLRIFNFSDDDVTDGTLHVAGKSTRASIPRRKSVQLAFELTASLADLDAWARGSAPRVTITPSSAAASQNVSMIPMRIATDRATTGALRHPRLAAVAAGSVAATPVTTVAGGGPDHVPATAAALGWPFYLALDSDGNLHIADLLKARIFRVDPGGELTVTAGTGKRANLGFNGDGGMAVDAIFARLSGLVAAPGGDMVSFEWGYHFGPDETQGHVRRIDAATGRIGPVITGYPFSCPSFNPYMTGGVYDSSGSLLFIDEGCGYVWRIDSLTGQPGIVAGNGEFGFSGDGGPATSASLMYPSSLAIDRDGNLYIGDAGNNRIRRVDATTGFITTVAGNGNPGEEGDGGPALEANLSVSSLALDPVGNIHFADPEANKVRRIDASTGIITPSAGTGEFGYSGDSGPATDATLAFPIAVVADAAGNLFISDVENNRVRRVDALTGGISTFAGGGAFLLGDGSPALDAELPAPTRIAVNASDEMFIVTGGDGRIRRVDGVTGIISTVAGGGAGGDGSPATLARIPSPTDVAQDPAGNLFIAEAAIGNDPARVRRVDAVTGILTTVAGGGTGGDGVAATQTHLDYPAAVEIDAAGNLYIADRGPGGVSGTVRRVDAATGIIMTIAGGGILFYGDGIPANQAWLSWPSGIALDAAGNIYIAEELGRRIRRVDAVTGLITTVAGSAARFYEGNTGDGGPATDAGLASLSDIVIDSRGDLYVSTGISYGDGQDTGRLRGIDAGTGIIDTVAMAIGPVVGLAADRRGNIFFVDSENYKVRRLSRASRRPVAVAAAGAIAECGAPLMLDASASSDADSTSGTHDDIVSYEWYEGFRTASETALGTGETLSVSLPPGVHQITLVVSDSQGERSADSLSVDVRDTLAPSLSVALSRSVLTPPNHRMVVVRATVNATDLCGPVSFTLKSITSNEPDDAKGKADGKTLRDIARASPGTADTSFLLRAERSSSGAGRVYTIVYEATDATGNTTTATALVTVPLIPLSGPQTSLPGPRTGY